MASSGGVLLSYHDSCLRRSDLAILNGNYWLNDNLIAFYFEYLEHETYKDVADKFVLLSPQVAQMIKSIAQFTANVGDVAQMLVNYNLRDKDVIIVPISDSSDYDQGISGSHWSLLAFYRDVNGGHFCHYDSFTGSMNRLHAQQVARILTPCVAQPGSELDQLHRARLAPLSAATTTTAATITLMNEEEDEENLRHHENVLNLIMEESECTQQRNQYDCGIHVLCNADAILAKAFRDERRPLIQASSHSSTLTKRAELIAIVAELRLDADQRRRDIADGIIPADVAIAAVAVDNNSS